MTQLALLSKQVDLADEQAQSLALLSPDHPAVTLVRAYVALKAGDLDKAEAGANTLLASSPDEPFAKGLKAEVLIAKGQMDEAIALLEQQHGAAPEDRSTIRALIAIYRSREDWRNLARIEFDAHRLEPKNSTIAVDAIEAFLRAGDVATASQLSRPLLVPGANPQLLEATLSSWARYAPKGVLAPDVSKLAQASSGEQQVAFANYFNRVGKPEVAAGLLGGSQLPVTHVNAERNAVLAQSLAQQGRTGDAKRLFDLVLDREQDQVDALRGRAMLEARTGALKQAVIDAQRLVTISPKSGEDRLVLASAYLAAGNKAEVRRTLWQAFQDLPQDERVYSALRRIMASTGDAEGQRRLGDELADQRRTMLKKELI
jgi:tetratricopeptide (TPR) repeat protein